MELIILVTATAKALLWVCLAAVALWFVFGILKG